MKAPIACPYCASTFSVARTHVGKRAKCPSCSQPFTITFGDDETMGEPSSSSTPRFSEDTGSPPQQSATQSVPPPPPSGNATAAASEGIRSTDGIGDGRRLASRLLEHRSPTWIAAAFVTLVGVVAYIGGRWHLKSQIRSNVSLFTEAFANSLNERTGPDGEPVDLEAQRKEREAEVQRILAGTQLDFGQICDREWYSIELSSLRIATPRVVSYNGVEDYDEEALVVDFTIRNRDERRVLSLHPDIRITDDVGNDVGQKYAGLTEKFENQHDYLDINPGETKIVSQAFDKPLPRTQALKVRLQLDSSFGSGKYDPLTYTADIQNVEGFD